MENLIDSLKRATDVGTVSDPDQIAAELRFHGVGIVRKSLESYGRTLEESEDWEHQGGTCWRLCEEETLRDDLYDRLALAYEEDADLWTLHFTQDLQIVIDKLQETTIRSDEKDQAAVRDRDDELTKLWERIDELKEYTP